VSGRPAGRSAGRQEPCQPLPPHKHPTDQQRQIPGGALRPELAPQLCDDRDDVGRLRHPDGRLKILQGEWRPVIGQQRRRRGVGRISCYFDEFKSHECYRGYIRIMG